MTTLVVLVGIPVAVLAATRTARTAIALVASALAMWTCAAIVENWFLNQPELYATLLFIYVLLPLVIAPLAGVMAGLLAGARGHLFACAGAAIAGCVAAMIFEAVVHTAGPIVDLADCFRDMAAPAILATSAAVLVASIASRRV